MTALSVACGAALALAYPRAGVVPLAWMAPVPWLVLLVRLRARVGFRHGYIFGLGFFGVLLSWVHGVLFHYTSLPLWLTVPIWVLLIGYLALYPALFGGLISSLAGKFGVGALLAAPVFWVGLEFARGRLLGGFPWGLAGYARTGGFVLQQSASVGGVALVSLLLVTAWSSLAILLIAGHKVWRMNSVAVPRYAVLAAIGGLLLVILVLVAGAVRLWTHPRMAASDLFPTAIGDPAGSLRIALVQGGWGSDLDYDQAKQALRDYIRLTLDARSFSPSMIVWPESNAPFEPEGTEDYLETLQSLSRSSGAALILGAVGGHEKSGLTNSAYLVGPEGIRARYDKRRLVQYGEYVPLKSLFPFIRKFVPEAGDFAAGTSLGIMSVSGRKIGVAICYEMIFPEEILPQARAGADLLVNITNDSWFPLSGPWQHADFSRVRAIETGLWTARAASTGLTLLVDPWGRVMASGPLGGTAVITARIPPPGPPAAPGRTLFVPWGEWVGKACATMILGELAFLAVGNIIVKWRWRSASPTARGKSRP